MKKLPALSPIQAPRTWRYKSSWLMIAVFLAVAIAKAQINTPASDPFEHLNREIDHAADEVLTRPNTIGQPLHPAPISVEIPVPATGRLHADLLFDRVNSAALHLEALGVNAKAIFEEEGVPVELLTIAAVESGFNPRALSPKGALGIWQFMPITARRYGLRVNSEADDRLNLELETRAAARYLRDLYLTFQDWPLALAAYNSGEDTIQKAIKRTGAVDFWMLRQQRLLPEETSSYVPAVLGLAHVTDKEAMRARREHLSYLTGKGIDIFAETHNIH